MSSSIGHSLAGLSTYAITQQFQIDSHNKISQPDWRWLIWLLAIAKIRDRIQLQ
jgi:hypothetical protein